MGQPALLKIVEGDVDLDGKVAAREDAGLYYAWARGLQLLCADKGLEKDIYLIRPSHENLPLIPLSWKMGYKAGEAGGAVLTDWKLVRDDPSMDTVVGEEDMA